MGHEGDSLPGFPSQDTFEFLALPHLQKISMPALECVQSVASTLELLAQRIAATVFRRFPKLGECVLEMTCNIIERQKDAARVVVEQQVESSVGYLFTNDPHYLQMHGSMENMTDAEYQKKQQQQQQQQQMQQQSSPRPAEEKTRAE